MSDVLPPLIGLEVSSVEISEFFHFVSVPNSDLVEFEYDQIVIGQKSDLVDYHLDLTQQKQPSFALVQRVQQVQAVK